MAKIVLKLDNWLYNSGLLGLYNILKESEEKSLEVGNNTISFDEEALNNFSKKYFTYLIKKYEKTLSWYKIISFKEKLEKIKEKLEKNLEEIEMTEIEELNSYIKDTLKFYIKTNSYLSAYEVIKTFSDVKFLDVQAIEKSINSIKFKKNENIIDKKTEIEEQINKIKEIISYFEMDKVKEQIAGKNIIYTVIKNFWDGLSFLNPQTKEKNIYIDYNLYFVETLKKYLEEDLSKYKHECFICDRKIKNFDSGLSFLNNIGYDIKRKSSHSWNFQNHIAICPLCMLVYSCIPAGFNFLPLNGNGIFINYNRNFKGLESINNKLYMEIYKPHEKKASLTYRALMEAFEDEKLASSEYEFFDIQVIRYENEKYHFSMLSRKSIKILKESKEEFNKLIVKSYSEGNKTFWIYDEALKKIINNENLNLLIHKLLWNKITNQSGIYYNFFTIFNLIIINLKLIKNKEEIMKEVDKKIYVFRDIGYNLRKKYIEKSDESSAKSKINTMAYKIMNGINTGDIDMVMSTIINSYMYVKEEIPGIVNELVSDNDKLKNYGYSFLIGLLGEKYNNDKKGEDENAK